MEGGPPHPVGEGGTPLTHRVGRMDPPHPVGEPRAIEDSPTGGGRPTLHGGWASVHGGQRSISLEYQICPPPLSI